MVLRCITVYKFNLKRAFRAWTFRSVYDTITLGVIISVGEDITSKERKYDGESKTGFDFS